MLDNAYTLGVDSDYTAQEDMKVTEQTDKWASDPRRMPTVGPLDTVIFSEHGRVINHVDYRSHWLCVFKPQFGCYVLAVKHAAGEERIELGYGMDKTIVDTLGGMDPDTRYLFLNRFLSINHDATNRAESKWRTAVAKGEVKRKYGRGGYRAEWVAA